MTCIVRQMTMGDIPSVVAIDKQSFSLPWPETSYRYELQGNTAARAFVAEADDHEVVAMIVSWLILDELHIATIATSPNCRRQGIGSQILIAALKDGQAAGARRAFLEVRAGNAAAQEMYHKFGFVEAGRRPGYYRDNGEDAVLMTLEPLEVL
ncbi:MAG TPA: ribosomal protein S18-alanine N-acetyltransferase [Anaerolineales bacterium]|nr:ribosomal protein S18-alanine N-acetyltransferase [Anaerolineales bacterium]